MPDTFDVVLPDGTPLKGIPVGTTKDQVMAKAKANGYNFDKPTAESSPPADKPPTMTGDISAMHKIGDDEPGYEYGDVLPFKKETATGKTSFALPEMIRSPLRGMGNLMQTAQNRGTESDPDAVAAMTSMIPGAKPAAKAITKGIEATGGKIAEGAVKGAENIASGAGTMKAGYNARDQESLEGAIKGMETQAQQHFSNMKGVGISPEISTKIFDHIDKAVREDREIDPDLHADYVKTIERMKEKAKQGMTLQQMHLQRQLLRDVESKNFLNNKPVASVARKAIDAMDDVLETAKHKGGSEEGSAGIHGMQSGIAQWAKARKFETIANIIQRSQGDPNKLKSGFTTLLNSKKQMRGFTAEEKAAIKAASENTSAEGLMKMVGKFGFDISQSRSGGNTLPWLAGFGAHMAGASTPALGGLAGLGTGAKYGQKLMARGKAENVLKQIENRPSIPQINTGTPLENVVKQIQ